MKLVSVKGTQRRPTFIQDRMIIWSSRLTMQKLAFLSAGVSLVALLTIVWRADLTRFTDLAWPEAFRALFTQGVELAIVPTYWTADDLTDEGKQYDPE